MKLFIFSFLREYFSLFESGPGATRHNWTEIRKHCFSVSSFEGKYASTPHGIKEKEWRNLCVKKVVEAVLEEEVEEKVECVGGGQGGVHTRQLGRQQRRHQLRHSQSADKIWTKIDNSAAEKSFAFGSLRTKNEPKKTAAPPTASPPTVCGQNMNQKRQQRRQQLHHWQSAGKIWTKMDNSAANSFAIGSLRAKYEPRYIESSASASFVRHCWLKARLENNSEALKWMKTLTL